MHGLIGLDFRMLGAGLMDRLQTIHILVVVSDRRLGITELNGCRSLLLFHAIVPLTVGSQRRLLCVRKREREREANELKTRLAQLATLNDRSRVNFLPSFELTELARR